MGPRGGPTLPRSLHGVPGPADLTIAVAEVASLPGDVAATPSARVLRAGVADAVVAKQHLHGAEQVA